MCLPVNVTELLKTPNLREYPQMAASEQQHIKHQTV